MNTKKTLVIGASSNTARYSNLAVKKLIAHGHSVIALGKNAGTIGNIKIETEKKAFQNINTVTLYVNPTHQAAYYDYIFSLHPKRIIFNPGTENEELFHLAKQKNIEAVQACTLVLLSTNQF